MNDIFERIAQEIFEGKISADEAKAKLESGNLKFVFKFGNDEYEFISKVPTVRDVEESAISNSLVSMLSAWIKSLKKNGVEMSLEPETIYNIPLPVVLRLLDYIILLSTGYLEIIEKYVQ